MDIGIPLQMLDGLIQRLLAGARGPLPSRGEVGVWCVLKKPSLHILLGTVIYNDQRVFSDLTPHPNLVQYIDPSWRRKNAPVLYVVIRAPAPHGGISYHLVDPAGDVTPFEVSSGVARTAFFLHTLADLPMAADLYRRVVGPEP